MSSEASAPRSVGSPASRAAAADAPRHDPGVPILLGRYVVVGTGSEPVALERVQPAGKGAMNAVDWWRGLRGGDELVAGA